MEKPISLSVKDWLIRKLAPKLLVSEKTLEAVVNHQFQSANEALANHESIEISGFGKFFFNHKKAAKRMIKLESQISVFEKMSQNPDIPEQKRESAKVKLKNALLVQEALKPKLNNELQPDLRGMEEQPSSTV